MLRLRDYLEPSCIRTDMAAGSKEAVIRSLVSVAEATGTVCDPAQLVADILERERLAPTGLGEACAIPHAHSSGVVDTRLVFCRLGSGVDFGAPDGQDARIVVLMVGPKDAAGLHLKLLSKLARLLHDPDYRSALMDAPDSDSLARLLYSKDD